MRIHVAGVDLVRDGAGDFRVLEDNLRVPSGISYVVENRRAMTRVFPELFASHRVRRVDSYPIKLLEALRRTAPNGVADPCVVVLTPGVHNSAYFEHSFLGPPDGRGAGGGQRPRRAGRDAVHAHDRRPATRRRRVPAHRRRLPRPAPVPARLGRRLRRDAARGPRRPGDDRERARQRRRRRQGRLPVRPGDDPVLPAARSRSSPTSRRTGSAIPTCAPGCSSGSTRWW